MVIDSSGPGMHILPPGQLRQSQKSEALLLKSLDYRESQLRFGWQQENVPIPDIF